MNAPEPLFTNTDIFRLIETALPPDQPYSRALIHRLLFLIRDGYQARLSSLQIAAFPALEWFDEIYPADLFDGSSGDPGPLRVAAIRENLRTALHARKEQQP